MDSPHWSSNASNTNSSLHDPIDHAGSNNVLEVFPVVTESPDGGWFGKIGTSVILIFGTFGNVMTMIVLRKLRTGWSAMNVYLTALAISDTVMLYNGCFPMWARKVMNFDIYASHVIACKGMIWLLNTAASLSAWLLVALTAQRAASVVWPHRINILCTRQKSVVISLVITFTFGLLYSHIMYGYELVKLQNDTSVRCTFAFADYQDFWINVWVSVDMVMYCVLPCTFLIICNAVLGWKLMVSVKKANEKFVSTNRDQRDTRKKQASSTTLTIFIVSTAFVLMTIPLMTYNTFFNTYASQDEQSRQFHYILYEFFIVFSLCNFAWNFYLYCLTGTKFRREFLMIMFGCCGYSSSKAKSAPDTERSQSSGAETVYKKNTESEGIEDF